NLFYNSKYGYDSSRRALSRLQQEGYLKASIDFVTAKKVYYKTKTISSHKLMLLSLYSALSFTGSNILEFKRELPTGSVRADGLIIYEYKKLTKILLIEIDINNKTKVDKFQKIYEEGSFQRNFGTFPRVLIINKNGRPYKSYGKQIGYKNIYINYDFKGLENII
ncbi:MAG: hypothetical protein ACRC7R_05020, partial [Sarcina sp.]